MIPLAGAHAHASDAAKPQAQGQGGQTQVPPRPANLDQVLATVRGEKITRAELLNLLGRLQIPYSSVAEVYRGAIDSLINARLIGQFVARQKVPPEKIDAAIAQIEANLKATGRGDLQSALQQSGETMEDLRRSVGWDEFVKLKATDAELKKFAASHKDLVTGALLKASHIYLGVPEGATTVDKEKVREKLLAIKQDILDKKTSFAAAANRFSEDPANAEGSGGDIGYFGLRTGILPEFAEAAFALKLDEISDPVETLHGFHLITVTDRKEGKPVDFEKQRDFLYQLYQADLRKQILDAERKDAEEKHAIEVQPMPTDLVPRAATTPTTSSPAAASGPVPASGPAPDPAAGSNAPAAAGLAPGAKP